MSLGGWLFRWWSIFSPGPPPPPGQALWRWTLDDDPSDLGDRRLLRFSENTGTITVTAPFSGSVTAFFWSPANQPGASDWPVGQYDAQIYVFVANPDVTVRLTSLFRFDGLGRPLELYAASGADLNCGTTGAKRWQGTTLPPMVQPSPGDRLRAGFTFTRGATKGSGDVTIGFGDPTRDYIEIPIAMANSQIVYGGSTLAFPGPLTKYARRARSDREKAFSGGAVAAGQLHNYFFELQVELDKFEDAQFRSDLEAFWSWAQQLKQFSFALDASDVVDLALSGAAAAGQKDIPLAVTGSVVVGKEYRLREAAGPEFEVIKVASITTNVKVTAVNNLKYGYLTGDSFRSLDYFPKLVCLTDDEPVEEHFTNWSLAFTAREDRG